MDAVGETPQPTELIPRLAGPSRELSSRRLLERAEAIHLGAASTLRSMGCEDEARRADQFAAWARFDLDEPRAARRLYAAAGELRGLPRFRLLLDKVLEGALSLAEADRGNVQLVDPATGSLAIVAEHGFGAEFLEYFAAVDDDRSACGRAAKRHDQVVITDVTTAPGFAPHRLIAAASGFRSVQSTPLTDRDGRLIGVVSTHYRRPHIPPRRERQVMRRYGELAGRAVAEHLAAAAHGQADGRPEAAVAAFLSAARAHSRAAEAHQRSIRAAAGDVAEHQRQAEFHSAAAEADRQRAVQAGEQAGPASPALPE